MLERFMTTLDCVDAAFISDELLDQLPLPSRLGKTRVGGVDLNNLRMRSALSAVLALAPSPAGFSTAHFRDKVQSMPRASKPTTWTATDRHYDQLQRAMQPLFHELGIAA